ncbi:MAG: DegT/DnrJ/EryC1/StrS family aminotransferase [Candidatus Nitrosotenuis sp.]
MITKEDKNAILTTLDSPLLTDGPKLREFESIFAKFAGAKFAIGVSNATAALHLSLKAAGIKAGDEVIIPDMTFVATAGAVLLAGATPVLVDINEELNISIESIEKSLTAKTKAILPVHFAGKPCDMTSIQKIARKNNLIIIEDCAHAIGAKFKKKHVGTFGAAGCFSFYPTKNITTIEGGMVITNDKKIADYIITLRNHGIMKSLKERYSYGKPWDYDVVEAGYNYRLDEIRSALGINQLKRINQLNLQRKKAFEYYNSKLSKKIGITVPKISDNQEAFHLYIIRIKKEYGYSRDEIFKRLLKHGIRSSVHYKPLHAFTVFKEKARIYDSLDHSKQAYQEIISLPFYPQISRSQQNRVIECLI